MADQVWLVTSGSYSDYSVDRVFSSEENAKRWIGEATDHFDVEPKPLDDFEDAPQAGMCGTMSLTDSDAWEFSPTLVNGVESGGIHITRGFKSVVQLWMLFHHTDRERAVKVMSEKRAALIASGNVWLYDKYDRDLTLISRDEVHGHKVLV